MRRVLPLLFLVFVAAAPPFKHKGPSKDALKPLQGTWSRTVYAYCPVGDGPALVAEDGDIEVTITGDRLTYTYLPEYRVAAAFTITVCAGNGSTHLDLQGVRGPEQGRSVPALYKVVGDTLRLATPLTPTGQRPASLNSVGSGERNETFTRKKP
jgi:uncharacterized protein (TIGR03067 family)